MIEFIMGLIFSGLGIVAVLAVYFVPSIIAFCREHPQFAGVFALNLLLGWTFLGWVAAIVWAVISHPQPVQGLNVQLECRDRASPELQKTRNRLRRMRTRAPFRGAR